MESLIGACTLLLIGIALMAALRLAYDPRPPVGELLHTILQTAAYLLIALGGLGLLVVVASGWGFLLWLVSLVIWAMSAQRQRQANRHALLVLLALAARRNMPLSPAVLALATEQGGAFGLRAANMASLLREGAPLDQALERSRVVSRDIALGVRLGIQAGVPGAALGQAVKTSSLARSVVEQASERLFYIVSLVCFGILVISFMTWKILPAIERIFYDFATELPALTQAVVDASRLAVRSGLVPAVVLGAFGLLALATLSYLGAATFTLPGLGFLMRPVHTAQTLRWLALFVEQQRPIDAPLMTLAREAPLGWMRARLRRVVGDIERGADWIDSLAAQGIVRPVDAALLHAAARAGNLPWAMRETADATQRRAAYRLRMLTALLTPFAFLVLGMLVMVVVVGYFLPLVQLIVDLT